jgi:hypothetical protein
MDPWDTLGVAHDVAVRDLRRRYATLIKEFRPETHPQEFARIREAYEIALELGRRREAQTAVEAEAEAASNEPLIASDTTALESTEAPAHAPQEAPIAPASESTETVVVTPLAAAEPQTRDAGPTLAQRFLQLHAEVASAGLADDEAHLPALRALLRAGSRAAIDDSQALEFALLRWFLESDAPPLTLVFEAGRAFGWHGQEQRLSAWLSAPASRRLEALLALARDRVHARHFSGNAALRRLHRRDNPFVAVASRPAALEAVQWAERWEALCERVDGSELGAALNAAALRRSRGRQLLSTEVWIGVLTAAMVAAATADVVSAPALAALVAVPGFYGLRRAAMALGGADLPRSLQRALSQLIRSRGRDLLSIRTACLVGAIVLVAANGEAALRVGGYAMTALAALLAAWGWWKIVAFVELAASTLLAWRADVDRLEFKHFMQRPVDTRPDLPANPPFGKRLGRLERLRVAREAMRLRPLEVAQRQRPAPLVARLPSLSKMSLGRRWWITAWLIFAVLRLLHAAIH